MTHNNTNTNVEPAKPATPVADLQNPADEVRTEGAGTDAQMPVEPSKLDALRKSVSDRHDGAEYATDDDFYSAIADDYEDMDKQIGEYKDRESRTADLFMRDQRSAKFMNDWIDGGDPVVALIRQYGDDFREALDDPEKLAEIEKANQEWVEAMAKDKELTEEYDKNIAQSLEVVDAYQQEKGLSDEEVDNAMERLRAIASDVIMGKYTPEMIEGVIKAGNYDADVATADREGEVRGKNERAEMQLRKPAQSDGMPQLGSRSGGKAPQGKQIPGALGREKKSIWDVGGGIKRSKG